METYKWPTDLSGGKSHHCPALSSGKKTCASLELKRIWKWLKRRNSRDLVFRIWKSDQTHYQVRQCLGFCTADFWSLLVYESAVHKPKHCQRHLSTSVHVYKYYWTITEAPTYHVWCLQRLISIWAFPIDPWIACIGKHLFLCSQGEGRVWSCSWMKLQDIPFKRVSKRWNIQERKMRSFILQRGSFRKLVLFSVRWNVEIPCDKWSGSTTRAHPFLPFRIKWVSFAPMNERNTGRPMSSKTWVGLT